jgi:hypothetical protein
MPLKFLARQYGGYRIIISANMCGDSRSVRGHILVRGKKE